MSNLIYLNYYPDNEIIPNKKYSIFSFDLDYTIIKTKSGNIFPTDKNDWELLFPEVKPKLISISKIPNSLIVIFSNQKGVGSNSKKGIPLPDFYDKINNIKKELEINFIFIAALKEDIYRKPNIGMWNYIMDKLNIKPNISKSFFVGDMAGRPTDDYDSDYQFAINLKLNFFTPEEYFLEN